MIRPLLLLPLLLLSGCGDAPPDSLAGGGGLPAGIYAGDGRDRLCVGEGQATFGLIAYGAGDQNCTAQGRIEGDGTAQPLALVPRGEEAGGCVLPIVREGDTVRIGTPPAACAYYCGPGASLDGRRFTRDQAASPAVDFAGDPLC